MNLKNLALSLIALLVHEVCYSQTSPTTLEQVTPVVLGPTTPEGNQSIAENRDHSPSDVQSGMVIPPEGQSRAFEMSAESIAPPAMLYPSMSHPVASRNLVQFRAVSSNSQEYAPLKILHVPYGAWLEIEGYWYQHKTSDNTQNVIAQINLSQIDAAGLMPSVIIRTGSSPREIRLRETGFLREVTLIPHQTVEFDYKREFGDLHSSTHSMIKHAGKPTANVNNIHAYQSSIDASAQNAVVDKKHLVEVETYTAKLKLIWDRPNRAYDAVPDDLQLLQLRGKFSQLSSLSNSCVLKADISFKLTAGSEQTRFRAIEIPLSLRNGVVVSGTSDAMLQGVADNFQQVIHGSNPFGKFLVGLTKNESFQCTLSNLRIEFNNRQFSARPISADQPVPGELILHVDVQIPPAN